MTRTLHLTDFGNSVEEVTIQFWNKFTQVSETDVQFREFILGIPEDSDVVFMNIDLDKARNICRVIEAKIAAEVALAYLD